LIKCGKKAGARKAYATGTILRRNQQARKRKWKK
jgi:hypothetical protein